MRTPANLLPLNRQLEQCQAVWQELQFFQKAEEQSQLCSKGKRRKYSSALSDNWSQRNWAVNCAPWVVWLVIRAISGVWGLIFHQGVPLHWYCDGLLCNCSWAARSTLPCFLRSSQSCFVYEIGNNHPILTMTLEERSVLGWAPSTGRELVFITPEIQWSERWRPLPFRKCSSTL